MNANQISVVISTPLWTDEEEVMRLLVEAHNKFLELKRGHPSEMSEWVAGIHRLQDLICAHAMRRQFPNYFN